jgi:hypothetical protein
MSKQNDPQFFASGYERNRLDRYWTNPWMTDELFKCVDNRLPRPIPLTVWECAAGRGDMSRAIGEHGRVVYSTDVDMSEFDNTIGPGHERSFLDEFELPLLGGEPIEAIITNPPYSEPWRGIADDFIKHGLMFMEDDGVKFMAMLLRSEFRSGKSRKTMFGECQHYMGELVLTTRPRWDYGDPNAPENAAPRHNFSWFLWQHGWQVTNRPVQLFSYMARGFKS